MTMVLQHSTPNIATEHCTAVRYAQLICVLIIVHSKWGTWKSQGGVELISCRVGSLHDIAIALHCVAKHADRNGVNDDETKIATWNRAAMPSDTPPVTCQSPSNSVFGVWSRALRTAQRPRPPTLGAGSSPLPVCFSDGGCYKYM